MNSLSDPPRILHLVETGGLYGAEKVILNLALETIAAGSFVPVIGCIVSASDEDTDLLKAARAAGIETARVVLGNRDFWWQIAGVALRLKRSGIGVIHSHGYKATIYGYLVHLLTHIQVTATCHLWFLSEGVPLKTRVLIRLEKYLYRHYPAVVAVSESIAEILITSGVPADKVRVVENGIELKEPVVANKRTFGAVPQVLNVGRLVSQKAQSDLIQAVAILARRGTRITVDIAGDGELRDQLADQLAREGLGMAIRLLGFRDDINDLLEVTDVFVLPSVMEGMPVSLLEAVAAGVPVITTAVGDIPKLITHEVSGLLVKVGDAEGLADAIQRTINDPVAAFRMADVARQVLHARYSCGKMYGKYAEIYSRLL